MLGKIPFMRPRRRFDHLPACHGGEFTGHGTDDQVTQFHHLSVHNVGMPTVRKVNLRREMLLVPPSLIHFISRITNLSSV